MFYNEVLKGFSVIFPEVQIDHNIFLEKATAVQSKQSYFFVSKIGACFPQKSYKIIGKRSVLAS